MRAMSATMPAIVQAKGVPIAQRGCGADQAFDLPRASQRSNVPVRELAERIRRGRAGRPVQQRG
jgi:hypothetical protein